MVRVTPKSGRDEVIGWRGEELGVRVTAAPEGGKANAATEKVLAGSLGVAKSQVRVVRGHASRVKHVEVQGMDQSSVESALGIDPALW